MFLSLLFIKACYVAGKRFQLPIPIAIIVHALWQLMVKKSASKNNKNNLHVQKH